MADNPTYYGPVPQSGSESTTIDTQSKGSLNCAVQQPTRFTISQGDPVLEEQFKCPMSKVTKLDDGKYKVFSSVFQIGLKHPEVQSDSNFICRFLPPQPPTNASWVVDQISVQEEAAGDHALLTIRSKAQYWNETVSDGSEVEARWDLEWRAVNMSVLAYCANPNNATPAWKRYIPNANNDVLKPQANPSNLATAQFIKECAGRTNFNQKWGQLGVYEWVRNLSIYELNDHEKEIYQYYINNMNPVLHVPVLTHTYTTKYARTSVPYRNIMGKITHVDYKNDQDKIGANIDEVLKSEQLDSQKKSPLGCPYSFDKQWEWLVTGDRMTEFNKEGYTMYQRVKEYTGAVKWTSEFYKNGTYSITGTPVATPWKIAER